MSKAVLDGHSASALARVKADYPAELVAMLGEAKGKPDPAAVAELRRRYDIEQLTALGKPPVHDHTAG